MSDALNTYVIMIKGGGKIRIAAQCVLRINRLRKVPARQKDHRDFLDSDVIGFYDESALVPDSTPL